MTLEAIELRLREVPFNYRVRKVDVLREHLALHKKEFVARDDQEGAKRVWCLEQVLRVQEQYIEAFDMLRGGRFYPAWCLFERVEIEDHHLRRHLRNPPSTFCLDFILEKTRQWQSLFPYRMFLSPCYLVQEKRCDICGELVRLRGGCEHRKGQIYDGEMCGHEITIAPIQEISLTPFPRQKYSVAFIGKGSPGNDNYNYAMVQAVVERVDSPFQEWEIQETCRRVPIRKFGSLDTNEECPCGSGNAFGQCCSGQDAIEMPWTHVIVPSIETRQITAFLQQTFRKPKRNAGHKHLVSTLIFDAQVQTD